MKCEIDKRLEEAFRKDYFQDADADGIWSRAAKQCGADKKHYAVPVAACITAAIAILAAVPPVRAAVADFFKTVGLYMAVPKEERPQVEGVNIQQVETGPPQVEAISEAAPEEISPNEDIGTKSWIGEIGEITIQEALYDGEKLYLTYTIDGRAVDLVAMGDDIAQQRLDKAEGETVRVHGLVSSSVWLWGEETDLPAYGYDWDKKNDGGIVTMTTEYTGLPALSGDQELTLRLQFSDYEMSKKQGEGGNFRDSVVISVPFTVNMDTSVTRLSGAWAIGETGISAEALVKPLEISVVFRVSQMVFFDQYEPRFYLNGELMEEMHFDYTSGSTDLEPATGRWYAPFPEETDVREFAVEWVDENGRIPENGRMIFTVE